MKPWLLVLFLASCFDPKVGRVVRPGGVARPLHECGRQSAEVAGLVDAAVLLVMDRSRSMAEGSKWDETRAAVEVALAAYDRYLRFGLLLYPTEADMCGEVDTELAVPIGLDSGADIATALADAEILRGTPTGAALRAAGEVLADDRGERRVVIAVAGVFRVYSARSRLDRLRRFLVSSLRRTSGTARSATSSLLAARGGPFAS